MAHEEQFYVDGWQTYSSWIDSIREENELIRDYDTSLKLKSKLLSCETNLARFKILWEDEKLHNEIRKIYKKDLANSNKSIQSRMGKSIKESERMRELGNKSFKAGNYSKALNQYTQAVRFAPNNHSVQQVGEIHKITEDDKVKDRTLALALANRSAALYALTRYRLCILDIDLAIKHGYPENNLFKLLIRKVKCLHILSVWANDVEKIKEDLKSMLRKSDTKDFVKIEINNMFEFLEETQPKDMEKDELDIVDESTMKISNVSKSLIQAADCVEMSYSNENGRYLMTNKDVSFGRLLIAEEPYVCNLAPSKRDDYCYNCFAKLYSCGLGCTSCTQVLYCSEPCMEANMQIHQYECNGFLNFHEKLGVAYLISHIMFKIDFDPTSIPICSRKIIDKKSLDEVLKLSPIDWPDLVYKNDYAAVLSLMDHATDYDYDEIMGYTITAVYMMIAFLDLLETKKPNHSIIENSENKLIVGSLVLRHLLQLQTNLISILDQDLQSLVSIGYTISDMKETPIGVGIYPTVSLLNHSCSPNILSLFHHNKFIARASRSLQCGTEINYCYGPSVSRMSKKDRQKRLKDQYFFTCECECCLSNKENECRALCCSNCKGPVIYNQDYTNECVHCKVTNAIDAKSYLKRIQEIRSSLNHLKDCDIDADKKIEKLKSMEKDLRIIAYRNHPLFFQIKSDLTDCAEASEDFGLAMTFCVDDLCLCAHTYGQRSYEYIMTELKLLNIHWQYFYHLIEGATNQTSKMQAIADLKGVIRSANNIRSRLKELLASTSIIGAESTFETELKFLNDIQASMNRYLASKEELPNLTSATVESTNQIEDKTK